MHMIVNMNTISIHLCVYTHKEMNTYTRTEKQTNTHLHKHTQHT